MYDGWHMTQNAIKLHKFPLPANSSRFCSNTSFKLTYSSGWVIHGEFAVEAATSTSISNQQISTGTTMAWRIFNCAGADQNCPLLQSRVKNPGFLGLGWKPCRWSRKMKERAALANISSEHFASPRPELAWSRMPEHPVRAQTGA